MSASTGTKSKDGLDPTTIEYFQEWCIKSGNIKDPIEFALCVEPLLKHIGVHKKMCQYKFEIFNFSLKKTGGPDDELYKKHPLLQKIVPRNLIVYITPWGEMFYEGGLRKFFGVEETIKEGVEPVKIYASTKENGKFTSHKFIQDPDGKIYVLYSSKNRADIMLLSGVPDYRNKEVFASYCKSEGLNDISTSILEGWMKIIQQESFDLEGAIRFSKMGYIFTGENIDGKHIDFRSGENMNKVFAMCLHGIPMNTNEAHVILKSLGYPTVDCVELPISLDIKNLKISDLIQAGFKIDNGCEGCVVYVKLQDGSTLMFKFKYPIYKMLRVLRRLILMFSWTANTLIRLHDALIDKRKYHDISPVAAARFFTWACEFVAKGKELGLSPKRVNFMMASWNDEGVLPTDCYGMGSIVRHLEMDKKFLILPEELGLDEPDLFKDDFGSLTAKMIPSVSQHFITKIVVFLVATQGFGKTTFGKMVAEKFRRCVYIDQDMFLGDSAACRARLEELLKDPNIDVIIVGRTNHEPRATHAYTEIVKEFPNVGCIFVGDEPSTSSNLISAFGLVARSVARSDASLIDAGCIKMGRSEMPFNDAMEIVKKVSDCIYESYFSENPIHPIIRFPINSFIESDRTNTFVDKWSTLESNERFKFLTSNKDMIASLLKPVEESSDTFCEFLNMLLSPSEETARMLRTFDVNTHPVHFELDYVAGNVDDNDVSHLVKFAMSNRGKDVKNVKGVITKKLHVTFFHPKGEGLNPNILNGAVFYCAVTHLVIDRESGHIAYRVEFPCPIQNKKPHITIFTPKNRKPVQSNEFVGKNDDSVIVIPLSTIPDFNTTIKLIVENVPKK
jgi:hypothetical protein